MWKTSLSWEIVKQSTGKINSLTCIPWFWISSQRALKRNGKLIEKRSWGKKIGRIKVKKFNWRWLSKVENEIGRGIKN